MRRKWNVSVRICGRREWKNVGLKEWKSQGIGGEIGGGVRRREYILACTCRSVAIPASMLYTAELHSTPDKKP